MGFGPCYASGVHIRAARGDIAVDTIAAGDEVVVIRDGQQTLEPVKWVGHSYIDVINHPYPEAVAPVRFRKDALAADQPNRDLVVSPEHCFIIDGLCVPAKLLVNGGSIVSERKHAPVTYYHIELERHGILLAENTPAESYLDTGNRCWFDNAEVPRQLHPDFSVNAGSARWLTDACAPLAKVPDDVVPIWRHLAERSVAIGYPIPVVTTVADADVHLLADGRAIRPLSHANARYVFLIPENATTVSLISRFCIPSDQMTAIQRDTRRLGVRVSWITIRTRDEETVLTADHPGLQQGWNDVERDGQSLWRWTDGAAAIPWDNISGSAIVTVRCSPVDRYPVYGGRLVA